MARRHRIKFAGAIYHVIDRGVRKSKIFKDDLDRHKYLKILATSIVRYRCICLTYCLMGNHYHHVIETPRPNISLFLQYLNGEYAKYFNRRHRLCGHVFQGRAEALLIEDTTYLGQAIAYIARNPVKARMVTDAAKWKWSGYAATVGKCRCPSFLTIDWLPRLFPAQNLKDSRRLFAIAVHSDQNDDIDSQIVMGSSEFRREVRKVIGASLYTSRLPRSYRMLGRPSLQELFAHVEKSERRSAILRAHVVHGYLLSEVAAYLDLHPTTISRIVNRSGRRNK